MSDQELRVQLDLAAADDSWVVWVVRKSGNRVRMFRKSHKFPVMDLSVAQDSIAEDISNEIKLFEQARDGLEGQGVG